MLSKISNFAILGQKWLCWRSLGGEGKFFLPKNHFSRRFGPWGSFLSKNFVFEKSPPKLKRELKGIVMPMRIFLLALSIPTFSFPIEWRWFHQNRSILKIAAKIEGEFQTTPAPKKNFFWVKKKALIETRILVPHMPT